ncbi:MAG TPA: tetratricopeptide repeat protein [Candidatus Krumholzibacterium sp.]|nr:tetratricopeptide repeat protein [Candidatus Krumholzibacterium sp.]
MSHNKLTKHELKEDNFVTFVLESWEYIRENQNKFFVGLVAIIVIIAGILWMNNSRMAARQTAEAQFSEAMSSYRSGQIKTAEEMFKIVEERFGNLEEGVSSSFFLGKCAMLQGRNTEAIGYFEDFIANGDKAPVYMDAAREGLAVAYENERDYLKAAEIYAQLADDLKVNGFMQKTYLMRAADNYKLMGQNGKAVELLERVVDLVSGEQKREVEIELELLRG